MINLTTEKDINIIRKVALLQEKELMLLRNRLGELTRKIVSLQEQLAQMTGEGTEKQALQKKLFQMESLLKEEAAKLASSSLGQGSERRPPQDTPKEDKKPKKRKPRQKTGPTKQPRLPIKEVIYPLDEADTCPECGGTLKPIEGQFEEAETIDIIETRYVLRQEKRQKYRCTCSDCQHIETALGPEDKLPRSRYTLNFVISIALSKYLFHMPLFRQAKQMKLEGLNVTTQTLWGLIPDLLTYPT